MKTTLPSRTMAAALLAAALPAAAQSSDQSGPITFTVEVARYVEVLTHEPSFHNLTEFYEPRGGQPPGYVISTHALLQNNPVWREVRANTPYRVSIAGLREDGKLVFTSQHGDDFALTTACENIPSTDLNARTLDMIFDCRGSGVYPPTTGRWILLHAYTPLRTDTNDARAGVYTATVYIQVDAA